MLPGENVAIVKSFWRSSAVETSGFAVRDDVLRSHRQNALVPPPSDVMQCYVVHCVAV